jgi:hypothetical protein
MIYPQKNPLPIPSVGSHEEIESTIKTVFDWQYALEEEKLLHLYDKGKRLSWNADELDWGVKVDLAQLAADSHIEVMFNEMMQAPRKLTRDEAVELRVNMNAFMLSQFLHGEQGALIATAKIVQTVPWEEAKFYAANQVADEARHVEVYHRYLTNKLGVNYEIDEHLRALLESIVRDDRWDITYLGMQILVEGLALAAFGMMRLMLQNEPLIQDITTRIMADEARHVAFGVVSLKKLYEEGMTDQELREREEFVIESVRLLRDRLLMTRVFERMDYDVDTWVSWMRDTDFNKGFRQMMFSKIVPNLKRLGLLTPRVRAAFDKLGLLKFEHYKDSIEEPEVAPPAELVQMLMQFMANTPAGKNMMG